MTEAEKIEAAEAFFRTAVTLVLAGEPPSEAVSQLVADYGAEDAPHVVQTGFGVGLRYFEEALKSLARVNRTDPPSYWRRWLTDIEARRVAEP